MSVSVRAGGGPGKLQPGRVGLGVGDLEETALEAELIRTPEAECLLFGLGQWASGEGYKNSGPAQLPAALQFSGGRGGTGGFGRGHTACQSKLL